jgi:hypothetical protein
MESRDFSRRPSLSISLNREHDAVFEVNGNAVRREPWLDPYLTFGDIAGKLHIPRIQCTRCPRKGRYSVAKLIDQHGLRGNMSKWVSDLWRPPETERQLHERCDLICPDLPKML